jgi:hypothetical protein
VNVTDYLLLASDDVSIFFDNRFVTKTALRSVSPGESFDVFLGIDPAVKVCACIYIHAYTYMLLQLPAITVTKCCYHLPDSHVARCIVLGIQCCHVQNTAESAVFMFNHC